MGGGNIRARVRDSECEEDAAGELGEGHKVDQLVGRKVVSEEDFKQNSSFEPGIVLYRVAWEAYADDEYTWEPCEHISSDLISDYERQRILDESEAADAEGEPEDEADDDELMEVDVDASEVEQVVPVEIVRHTLQWVNKKKHKGGLGNVWVMLKYSDGSRTPGYVSSEFLDDSKEGLDLLRAYTKRKDAHKALKYMPWV